MAATEVATLFLDNGFKSPLVSVDSRTNRKGARTGTSHQVLHLSENAGRYTQPIGGPLTGDIVDLIRSEFRAELRAALHRAFDQHHAASATRAREGTPDTARAYT
jgi:hypothetical protein